MARALVILACVAAGAVGAGVVGVAGGCAVDKQYSQTQLNALQTREFDGTYDQTFDAAVGALFDLGYAIHASDKRGGVIGAGGVQLKLDHAGERRTAVRVSTSSGGQVRVNEDVIKRVLDQIDRRLTAAPPTPTPGAGGR